MKRTIQWATTLALALTLSHSATASNRQKREVRINEERFATLSATEQAEVMAIKDRLEVVLATDRSALDRNERAALRTEWRQLKKDMDEHNRGGTVIYLSTAAIIIIILLLILIL